MQFPPNLKVEEKGNSIYFQNLKEIPSKIKDDLKSKGIFLKTLSNGTRYELYGSTVEERRNIIKFYFIDNKEESESSLNEDDSSDVFFDSPKKTFEPKHIPVPVSKKETDFAENLLIPSNYTSQNKDLNYQNRTNIHKNNNCSNKSSNNDSNQPYQRKPYNRNNNDSNQTPNSPENNQFQSRPYNNDPNQPYQRKHYNRNNNNDPNQSYQRKPYNRNNNNDSNQTPNSPENNQFQSKPYNNDSNQPYQRKPYNRNKNEITTVNPSKFELPLTNIQEILKIDQKDKTISSTKDNYMNYKLPNDFSTIPLENSIQNISENDQNASNIQSFFTTNNNKENNNIVLIIKNLSKNIKENQLIETFKSLGKIISCEIPYFINQKGEKENYDFGFLELNDNETCDNIIKIYSKAIFNDQEISFEISKKILKNSKKNLKDNFDRSFLSKSKVNIPVIPSNKQDIFQIDEKVHKILSLMFDNYDSKRPHDFTKIPLENFNYLTKDSPSVIIKAPLILCSFLVETFSIDIPKELQCFENKFDKKILLNLNLPLKIPLLFGKDEGDKGTIGLYKSDKFEIELLKSQIYSVLNTIYSRKYIKVLIEGIKKIFSNIELKKISIDNDCIILMSKPFDQDKDQLISFKLFIMQYNWNLEKENKIIDSIKFLLRNPKYSFNTDSSKISFNHIMNILE